MIIDWYIDQHFRRKKSFPIQKLQTEQNNIQKGKIINPFKTQNTIEEQNNLDILEHQKATSMLYCESLFMFWKTGICFEEIDYQFIYDVCLLIKGWERTKTELHYEFWGKAFGGKKGGKK